MRPKRAITSLVALVGITAASLATGRPERPEPVCAPRVRAILSDGHRLVPGGLGPVRRAVEHELRRLGVQLTWTTHQDSEATGSVLRVVLLPHAANDWGRSGETLGAVLLDGRSPTMIYVFYPAVEQVLGAPTDTTSILRRPSGTVWVRGLSRIILHEMVHFLLPGRPHDPSGLFAQNLKAGELLGPKLELDVETRSALVGRLCARAP